MIVGPTSLRALYPHRATSRYKWSCLIFSLAWVGFLPSPCSYGDINVACTLIGNGIVAKQFRHGALHM
eukprot:scaffold180809_cov23-Prasinocladus_malaysianus.AAC.1